MDPVGLIIAAVILEKPAKVALNIATWCFNKSAENQRIYQRSVIASTRSELRAERNQQYEIQREARQAVREAQRASHQEHYEMLREVGDTIREMSDEAWEVLRQFQDIGAQNRSLLKSLALTPEQRAAIHECNDQLDRGCQRLHAYVGPYIGTYRSELHNCFQALKNRGYVQPSLPQPALPESFPFKGELMEFDPDELGDYPFVDLGHGQRGRFIAPSRTSPRPEGSLVGMIDRYDRDNGFWIISAARADLAMDLDGGAAFRQPRTVTLAERRGDARIAWWQHRLGEQVMLRFEEGSLSQRMRRAPWGTPVQAFIQGSDFLVNRVNVGERISREQKHSGWIIPCSAAGAFWDAYSAATAYPGKMLVRESGMEGDPADASLVLRLVTGHEFPIRLDAQADRIVIGDQCGERIGVIQGKGRNLFVFLLRGRLVSGGDGSPDSAARLASAIQESFAEQHDLGLLAEADALELRKYRTVLQAEFEASKRREMVRIEFTDWTILDSTGSNRFVVQFNGNRRLPDGLAVRVLGEEEILGWSQPCETAGLSELVILRERRRAFRDEDFPQSGKLEAVAMDRELLNKLDGIENFLSAAAAETRTAEEQAAFSILRRELLGSFESAHNPPPVMAKAGGQLDEHQSRAVALLAGSAPLVLIQGPPGTGKTHVISHAISEILSRNPKARIAITSQANPAVDEAVSKIQESFPSLQIYRDYSAAAKEKYASLDRGVGIGEYHSQFIKTLEAAAVPDDARAAYVQTWLKESMRRDSSDVEADMRQILAQGSQVLACTLSRLAGIAASAPAFDLVIVDEAAKASVPEAMVAANCAKRLALVGDHLQLLPYLDESYYEHSAPNLEDQNILKDLWSNSLFSRLWSKAPEERKAFLAIMRRSRRPIANCISSCFYGGDLIAGRDDGSPTLSFPLSLIWIDSGRTCHQQAGKTSIKNTGEIELIFAALKELPKLCRKDISVAVITFHRGQAELLQSEIKRRKPSIVPSVLTVDASQGGQWDVVLLSLARTAGGSGFVGNRNRLNVALSRAKELCVIVGSRDYAQRDRTKGSFLSKVLNFVCSEPRTGKWVIVPDQNQNLPNRFGFPPPKRRR
jgi:Cdc6-like AAA superfamily ATPase